MTQASEWASVPEPESQHDSLNSQLPSPDGNVLLESAAVVRDEPPPAASQQQSPAASQCQSPAAVACDQQHMSAAADVESSQPTADAAVSSQAGHTGTPAASCSIETSPAAAAASPASTHTAAASPQQTHNAVATKQQLAGADAVFDKERLPAALTAEQATGIPASNTAAVNQQTHSTLQLAQNPPPATDQVSLTDTKARVNTSLPQLQQIDGPAVHVSASQSSSYQAAEVLAAMALDTNEARQAVSPGQAKLALRPEQAQHAQCGHDNHEGETVQQAKHLCVAQ